MADEERPRVVFGEIMTDGAASRPVEPSDDVIDAEYIRLPPTSPRADISRWPEPPVSIGTGAAPAGGMEMLRRKQVASVLAKPARGGPLFWATGIGLALAAFWVSGGHALIGDVPFGTAAPGALTISGVTSRVDTSGARPILLVDGEAANNGASVEHLPALEIAVAGNDGHVIHYRLGTSGRPMASGETFAFSSRLDVPKNGVKTVSVAFAE